MKFILKCDEANHTCDKTQYKEASFWEKVLLNIHLIYCSACRKYTRRNGKLTKLMRKSGVKAMPLDDKAALRERLRQEMTKY